DRTPPLRLDVPRPVSAAGGVFHQQNVAAAKGAALAVGGLDLDRPVEQDDELPLRGGVPVVVVARLVGAEDHGLGGDGVGKAADLTGLGQPDSELGEVAVAVLVGVHARDLHDPASPSCAAAIMRCRYPRATSSSSSLIVCGMPG